MKRGQYFKYLQDPNIPVPYTTRRDREIRSAVRNQANDNDNVMEVDDVDYCDEEPYPAVNRNDEPEIDSETDEESIDTTYDNESPDPSDSESIEQPMDINSENEDINEDFDVDNQLHEIHEDIRIEEQVQEQIFDENAEDQARVPIYDGCDITEEESDALIMAYAIKHNSTDDGLHDLLEIINCHCPRPINLSKYRFLKKFEAITKAQERYFCPECFLKLEFPEKTVTAKCLGCQVTYFKNHLKRTGSFFVFISLKEQLQKLFSGTLYHKLNRDYKSDPRYLSEVLSGKMYQSYVDKKLISPSDLTIMWNIDGVNVFKSSNFSMTPIQVVPLNLEPKLQKENIILCGYWYSPGKPVMDLFLEPFVEELKDLHENGFNCLPPGEAESEKIKVHSIVASTDAVERCCLQHISQFNGAFGCSCCLQEGEEIPVGRGFARVYEYEEPIVLRSIQQHKRDAIKAEEKNDIINGVKGLSLIMLIPLFSIVSCFPPEYMHCILLGVVKTFCMAWFSSKNCEKPWYLGEHRAIIEQRLLSIQPPSNITRTPRSLDEMKHYKASEWKNFALYYSIPCLKGFMPEKYLKHWSLLVFSLHKLLADKIDKNDLSDVDEALKKFVQDIEPLYGKQYMKFNVHCLLHLVKCVEYFGALWGWSAFMFESYNKVLRDMITGSQSVLTQICKSYLRLQTIKNSKVFERNECNIRGKNLYNKMIGNFKKNIKNCITFGRFLRILGPGKMNEMDLLSVNEVEELLNEPVNSTAYLFDRFIYKNNVYHGSSYGRMFKRNNSFIMTKDGRFFEIKNIARFETNLNEKKFVIIGKCYEPILTNPICRTDKFSSSTYSTIVRKTNNIGAFLVDDIGKKCTLVPYYNNNYVATPLVNSIETD